MVVDYKKLKSSPKILEDGVLWVAEQIPGKVVAKDQVKYSVKEPQILSFGWSSRVSIQEPKNHFGPFLGPISVRFLRLAV